MSILSWLKRVGGDADAIHNEPIIFAAGEESLHGLNMKDAIDAHMKWTQRLQMKLAGSSDEPMDVATVASDQHCTLGKWLHGAGKMKFSRLPEYGELQRVHAEFHLAVGNILNRHQHGEADAVEQALRKVRYASGNVQLALIRLYSKAAA